MSDKIRIYSYEEDLKRAGFAEGLAYRFKGSSFLTNDNAVLPGTHYLDLDLILLNSRKDLIKSLIESGVVVGASVRIFYTEWKIEPAEDACFYENEHLSIKKDGSFYNVFGNNFISVFQFYFFATRIEKKPLPKEWRGYAKYSVGIMPTEITFGLLWRNIKKQMVIKIKKTVVNYFDSLSKLYIYNR
jgi:hypothetical protein